MGAVFRPKDLSSDYKKVIDSALKDLNPDTKDSVIKLFEAWEDKNSNEKLKDILGSENAQRLLKKLKSNKEADLTVEDRKTINSILKDSLTFD